MREIEFRGKRLSDREWIYGYYVSYDAGEASRKHEIIFTTGNWDYVDPETVGQYIGLKDKNGNKIYDGDIVTSKKYPFQDEEKHNYHGIICWLEDALGWCVTLMLVNSEKLGISHGIRESLEEYMDYQLEVIGNIHDNPELLEVK